ncbi:23S rRNA (guanosine(2251)-2'-O)-methyltransferase RlmB [Rhodoligotrophos appendicifer]|uniref:23S rRNA (guanosine(2251)-2'-O)-methyltransferase RlmB n=2 Tax=Rhodoligotrophos appendicifer TaxID=987056 RepID=UPI0011851018
MGTGSSPVNPLDSDDSLRIKMLVVPLARLPYSQHMKQTRYSRQRHPHRGQELDSHGTGRDIIYGSHAVLAALRNPRRHHIKLWLSENASHRFATELPASVPREITAPKVLDQMAGPDAVHQGLVLEAHSLEPVDLEDVPGQGLILLLDQVTDPHNVGAVLRLAAAFGAHALVTTERHSPGLTAALAKAASGGLEHVAFARETNLAQAIQTIKNKGFTVIGLDSEAEIELSEAPLQPPLALVFGAEGKGLRRLTKDRCDMVARISLPGPIASLNVSTAAAIALYIVTREASIAP